MTTTSTFPVSISVTLEDLRRIIEDKENYAGPLVAISPYEHSNTWITYANDNPPKRAIALRLINPDSTPPVVANHQLICIGDCFIEDSAQRVAVYREN